MKIHLNNIPKEGLNLENELSLESLNNRMSEGQHNDIVFTKAPNVKIKLKENIQCVQLQGNLKTEYKQACGFCLDNLPRKLQFDFYTLLKEENEIDGEDDSEIIFYNEPIVDIEDFLQEQIIMSLSPFFQPEKEENGDCSICKKSVAKILKQDGVKDNSIKQPFANLGELIKKKE